MLFLQPLNVLWFSQIVFPRTFLRAKDAVWPPRTSLTGILLRWMDFTAMGMKVPSGSGPKSSVSLSRIIPRNVVPETTVPTPCQENINSGSSWFTALLPLDTVSISVKPGVSHKTHTAVVFSPLCQLPLLSVRVKGVEEMCLVYILLCCLEQWQSLHTHLHRGFCQWRHRFSSVFSLKDVFTWHTAAERHTGFCISHNLQHRDSHTAVVSPQGLTLSFTPLSTILFGPAHIHSLQKKSEKPEEKRVTEPN